MAGEISLCAVQQLVIVAVWFSAFC